jgi:predicted DNA binding protein
MSTETTLKKLQSRKVNKTELSRILGMKRPTYLYHLSSRTKPLTADMAAKIEEALKVYKQRF